MRELSRAIWRSASACIHLDRSSLPAQAALQKAASVPVDVDPVFSFSVAVK